MASARAVVVGLLVAVLGFGLARAAAQSDSPPVAWEKQFPKSIDWYVRTSTGVLLVRSGNMLHAVDGKDGRELWSMKGLDLGGSKQRGKNISEIPGTPVLLVKSRKPKARMRNSRQMGSLLAVDLWKGTLLWQQYLALDLAAGGGRSKSTSFTGVENFQQLIPFYDSERILLVNDPGMDIGKAFKARLQLQHMFKNKVEWRQRYPATLGIVDMDLSWEQIDGELYAHKGWRKRDLGRLDLETGERVWKFQKPYLTFADGKILFGGKDVVALDPVTREPVWQTEGLGGASLWVLGPDALFVSGEKQVAALDLSTGAVRWRVESEAKVLNLQLGGDVLFGATNRGIFALKSSNGELRWRIDTKGVPTFPVWFEETHLLVFSNKSELVVVDGNTGKILRNTELNLERKPGYIQKQGGELLMVSTRPGFWYSFRDTLPTPGGVGELLINKALMGILPKGKGPGGAVFNVTTGEKLWEEPNIDTKLPPVSFLVLHPLPAITSYGPSELLQTKLRNAWDLLRERADQNPGWEAVLERLEPFVQEAEEGFQPAYLTRLPKTKDRWKLWRIDPSTGRQKEWFLTGFQPDFIPAFGLAYTFSGKNLQAFRLSGE